MAMRPNLETMETFKGNQIKFYDALRQFALSDLNYDSKSQQRFIRGVDTILELGGGGLSQRWGEKCARACYATISKTR